MKKPEPIPSKDVLPFKLAKRDIEYKYRPKDPRIGGEEYNFGHLQLAFTERFGWCIRTLFISGARRGIAGGHRSYAISIATKELVSLGAGPHILREVSVYLHESRRKVVQPLMELYVEGMKKAGEYRDVRSTRRVTNAMRRSRFY